MVVGALLKARGRANALPGAVLELSTVPQNKVTITRSVIPTKAGLSYNGV